MPIHEGHVALINFAIRQCDELIVSMNYSEDDPLAPLLRFSWIQQIFRDNPAIKSRMVKDDFDDAKLQMAARVKIWSDFIKRRRAGDPLFSGNKNFL